MQPSVNMQLITNEVSIKNNHLPDGRFNISYHLTRNINPIDNEHSAVELILEIDNSDEAPFPVDLRVSMTGIFNISTLPPDKKDSFLKIQAVQIIYPYIRAMVSSITSSSLMPPIILPIVDVMKLFPEDA